MFLDSFSVLSRAASRGVRNQPPPHAPAPKVTIDAFDPDGTSAQNYNGGMRMRMTAVASTLDNIYDEANAKLVFCKAQSSP